MKRFNQLGLLLPRDDDALEDPLVRAEAELIRRRWRKHGRRLTASSPRRGNLDPRLLGSRPSLEVLISLL
jgi:hypothetical protein